MKNITLFLLSLIVLISCKNDTKEITTVPDIANSKYYQETMLRVGNDFLGFNLGENFETASIVFSKEHLQQEENDYLYYKISNTYTEAEYQLIFEDEKLKEIDFDVHVYDEKGNFNTQGAETLFTEIKADFLKRFGNKYMESSEEENEILYWSKDKKNIQLIHEKAKAAVHVYADIVEFN